MRTKAHHKFLRLSLTFAYILKTSETEKGSKQLWFGILFLDK